MKYLIKMIVLDLDRTLFNANKAITDYSAQILLRCKQQGIKIVFATARSENSSKTYIRNIKPDAVISNGGAVVRVAEKIIYRAVMDTETTNKLLLSCINQPAVGYITVDTDNGYFVNKPVDNDDPNWVEYLPAYHVDFSLGLDCDAYKIAIECSDSTTVREIISSFPTVDVLGFSGEDWYRFADKTANKWAGIMSLMNYWNIIREKVIAFGDDFNDIDMLRECGRGVAVANAIDEVKAVADYICDSNDNDGAAKWIEERIL